MFLCTVAPPTYTSSVGNSGILGVLGPDQQQQQQAVASQMIPSAGYYSSAAAAALPPPSVYDAGDNFPPVKI